MERFSRVALAAICSLSSGLALASAQQDKPDGPVVIAQGNTAPAKPASARLGALVIEAPWTRATPAGAKVGGGYMTITNTGTMPDRLIGGTFPLAGRFEVHEMAVTNGVMTMRELARGLEIAPGQTVELKPGGLHLMFLDLTAQLRQGQPIRGTLVFEKAGTVEIEYQVAPIGARAPAGAHAH